MLANAAGLACLAAVSPTALLVSAAYLGSARPRLIASCYLAGAILVSVIAGTVVVLAIRSGHLNLPSYRIPRYELRLGLGILLLASAGWTVLRRPSMPAPQEPESQTGLMAKLLANPAPATAVAAGVVVFAPGVTFIAAVQVIGTAQASLALSALGLVIVAAISVCFAWIPLIAFLAAPGHTTGALRRFNAWLRANARFLLSSAMLVAGVLVTVNGIWGLTSSGG